MSLDCSCSSSSLGCGDKLLIWDLSTFIIWVLNAINFPLSTDFAIFHRCLVRCVSTYFCFKIFNFLPALFFDALVVQK
jgi:hypothetical protein